MALLNPAFVPEPRITRGAQTRRRSSEAILRLVPTEKATVKPVTFSVVLVGLLVSGLLSLLLLNTMLTANSFALHSLQQQARTLTDKEQALTERLVRTESPQSLASRAASIGMVPSGNANFLILDSQGQR